jgi:hypothetical protein
MKTDRLKNRYPFKRAIPILLIGLVLIVSACGKQERISKNDKKKFIDIYVELTLAYWNSQKSPGSFQSLATAVFEKYNVDKAYLMKTQKKFENNPDLQLDIYKEIAGRLKGYDSIQPDSLDKIVKESIDLR